MSNSFKRSVQHFLSFSRSDRNAIIILSTIIFILVLAIIIQRNIEPVPKSDFVEIKTIFDNWEKAAVQSETESKFTLFDFDPNTISQQALDSLSLPDFIKRNLINYRNAGGKYKYAADVRKIYGMNDSIFSLIENHIQIKPKENKKEVIKPKNKAIVKPSGAFDPNSATVTELTSFGFSQYQANNLVNYRSKGGAFKNAADIKKIYGIDSAFYSQIKAYIKIEEIEKGELLISEEISLVELNSADSIELIGLKGIGVSYAKRIIKYRNLLGGYYSKNQLNEIYHFPEETYTAIQPYVYVDTLKIVKLRINFAEFPELLRHPYLNKSQVKELLDKREKVGSFKNSSELQLLKAFDSETIRKIRPYITCR